MTYRFSIYAKWIAIAAVMIAVNVVCSQPTRSNVAGSSIAKDSIADSMVEVAWLESTGQQYIVFDEKVDGFEGWRLPENSNNAGCVGIWNNGARGDTFKWMSLYGRGWTISNGSLDSIYSYDTLYAFSYVSINETNVVMNGNRYAIAHPWGLYFNTAKFALFGVYNTKLMTVSTQACKIGACKLYCNGEMLHDLVPVKFKNADGIWEGAFIDLISEDMPLVKNQGDGMFVVGPTQLNASARKRE